MTSLVRRTWLPTLVFAIAPLVGWAVASDWKGLGHWNFWYEFSAYAAVITPPIWWWLVVRAQKRILLMGLVSGSAIGFLIHAIPLVGLIARANDAPDGGLGNGMMGLLYFEGLPIGTLIGGCLGLLMALGQRPPSKATLFDQTA